jgi:hypothetical protein
MSATGTERPKMILISFKRLAKGSLRGFANIEFPSGLRLADCPVFLGKNGAFAGLPTKPVIDREGRHAEVGGKRQYSAILEWRDRDLSDRFSQALVALVRAAHPDVFDDGGSSAAAPQGDNVVHQRLDDRIPF